MSKAENDAMVRAFNRGQQAWREGKDYTRDNPFPPQSPYYSHWQQGWEAERDVHQK